MKPDRSQLVAWLAENWTSKLGQILESMADQRPRIEWKQMAPPPAAGADVPAGDAGLFWWEQSFNVLPESAVWIGAPETTWMELGGRILRAAGVDEVATADAKNTYLEIVSQS